MHVSVIIPTYERPVEVRRLLDCLNIQSFSPQLFEAIVVDDGSSYDESQITGTDRPYHLIFIRQTNQGATKARNNGALHSQGEVLVFIDDDVTISPTALETLHSACTMNQNILAMGNLIQHSPINNTVFARLVSEDLDDGSEDEKCESYSEVLHYTFCNTQLLAISKQNFTKLDMLQDPTGGWPNWDDVDFGYRAHLAGFQLLRYCKAKGVHWDNALSSLDRACQRWFRASKSAVQLFERHPGIQSFLPMYFDKTPISWKTDPPILITRKLLRIAASNQISIRTMEFIVMVLEKYYPSPKLLLSLYLWIQGGYMRLGYIEGIREARNFS